MADSYFNYSSATDPGERRTEGEGQATEAAEMPPASQQPEPRMAEARDTLTTEMQAGADANGQASTGISEAKLDISPGERFDHGVWTSRPTGYAHETPSMAPYGSQNGLVPEQSASAAAATNGQAHHPGPESAAALRTDGMSQKTNEETEEPDTTVPTTAGTHVNVQFTGKLPRFAPQASACLNKAAQLAADLNHTCFSQDHLMLALTLEPTARRTLEHMLERIGTLDQLRAEAMQKIARLHLKYSQGSTDSPDPLVTEELWDIFMVAKQDADERGQDIAISDLINAFPQDDRGQLIYGAQDSAAALTSTVQQTIIPSLLAEFQRQLRDAARQQLDAVLQEFASNLKQRVDQIVVPPPPPPAPPIREIPPVPNPTIPEMPPRESMPEIVSPHVTPSETPPPNSPPPRFTSPEPASAKSNFLMKALERLSS